MNKKQFTILLILVCTFLVIIPLDVIKAENKVASTSPPAQLKNKRIERYMRHPFNSHKYINYLGMPYNIHNDTFENDNISEFFIKFIEFVNKNILGIIFCVLFFYLLCRLPYNFFHNRKILRKYKRENDDNDKKFTTKRCKEDGDKNGRNHVYLINENDKTYQRLEDSHTLKKLGYGSASRGDDLCFSNKEYTIKEKIKIYNIIIFDIKEILEILKLKNN